MMHDQVGKGAAGKGMGGRKMENSQSRVCDIEGSACVCICVSVFVSVFVSAFVCVFARARACKFMKMDVYKHENGLL